MQKSIFFRRVLSLLIVALLLWAVLTALLYSFISRPVFTRIKVAELEPKAISIADLAAQSFMQVDPYFNELVASAFELFDAWIFIVDGLSGEINSTSLPDDTSASAPQIQSLIEGNLSALLSGEASSIWFTGRLGGSIGEVLFVGVPVYLRFGRQRTVVGAVYFVKPQKELNAGLNSMNIALLVSTLVVFALMTLPAYLATARLIRPLRQTRDVAMAMADGNFNVRADSRQKGEIGELAATMNNLARDLSRTISDLVLERNRLKQILEGMSDGLLAVGPDGRVIQANQAALAMLAPDDDQDVHRDNLLAVHPELHALYQRSMQDNAPVAGTLQADGRVFRVQIAPLATDSGQSAGAVALLHDITEAERLEQTRRDYVANVSHELRSPLTAMRALIEPLNDGMVADESDRQRYYQILLRENIRLSRLIDDMLELSRLQAGILSLDMVPFDLAAILDDLYLRYRRQAEVSQLGLMLPDNLDSCPTVLGDPDRVEQVLVILLDNALKFTRAGGHIQLLLDWSDSQVFVSVQDDGIGIDPQDIKHVFDRFYKADKAHNQPGTGLGLSIAREVLQLMGQGISVRSRPGQGTTFTFTLALSNQRHPAA